MSSLYGASGGGSGNRAPSGYNIGRIQNFGPEKMKLYQSLLDHLGPDSFLSKLASGDQSMFEQMEAPAMRQFAGLQGDLASRFSRGGGAGSLSSRGSSGFINQSNRQASDFAQGLQSKRLDLQRQAIGDLRGFGNDLLNQKPYEQFLTKKPDFLSQILEGGGDIVDMITKILPFLI